MGRAGVSLACEQGPDHILASRAGGEQHLCPEIMQEQLEVDEGRQTVYLPEIEKAWAVVLTSEMKRSPGYILKNFRYFVDTRFWAR